MLSVIFKGSLETDKPNLKVIVSEKMDENTAKTNPDKILFIRLIDSIITQWENRYKTKTVLVYSILIWRIFQKIELQQSNYFWDNNHKNE